MTRGEIRDKIIKRAAAAGKEASLAREENPRTFQSVAGHVYNYVCYKLYLEPEKCREMSLSEMADMSLDRALAEKLPLARESEKATTCGAAGSSAMKTALLLTAAKKDFGADIDAKELGAVKNVNELSKLIFEGMK